MNNSIIRWAIHRVLRVQRIKSLMRVGAFAALAAMAFTVSAQTGALTIAGTTYGPQACAVEGGVCSFSGTYKVAYGAAGKYSVRTLTGPAACSNGVFGDPIVGTAKKCYLDAAAPVISGPVCFFEHINYSGKSYCVGAGEASTMPSGWDNLVSSVRIAPGFTLDMFDQVNKTGRSVSVNVATPNFFAQSFNDLMSSYRVLASAAPLPASFTVSGQNFSAKACATEGGQCAFSGTRSVAYGAKGQYVVKSLSGPVYCNNSVFGDPIKGTFKACYLQSEGTVTPTPTPRPCVAQTLSWTVAGNVCSAVSSTADSGLSALLSTSGATTIGSASFQCLNGNWGAAINPICNSTNTVPNPVPVTKADAARLLVQATYGPTLSEINNVAAMGADAWLTEQFNTPSMDTHWDYVMVRKGPIGCTVCDSQYINATMESFWTQAVRGPDQLRQRTVFALSELFVVSTENSAVPIQADAHASYLDMLSRNAFGNFRTLLEQVSTHPTMAHYLSHMKNQKEDPVTGRIPDENYAREVMQLFTIGLWQLNPDGSRKKDGNGRDIPTFEQADVMGLAKVFTGWSWNGPDKSGSRWEGWIGRNWKDPLQNYPDHHSQSEKRFLGASVPAGSSGEQSLKVAMDTLFNHPNVGPFIGSQLIKRLVTSNPSPAYVARVTQAFNNTAGMRGDMKAVIRAVLMDPEARDNTKLADPQWGKLREPMVRFANWMRAFDAKTSGRGYFFSIWNLEDPVSSIGQNPLRAPSVFNWYRPGYAPPGEIMRRGLVAPEFQITHETTVTGYANFIAYTVDRGHGYNDTAIKSAYTAELGLAGNPAALLDHLNLLLLAGQMTPQTRDTVLQAVNALPATNARGRVITAITLVMLSPDFIVQK